MIAGIIQSKKVLSQVFLFVKLFKIINNSVRISIMTTKTITLIQPDDWHVHLRENHALLHTIADTGNTFARALVMPNLKEPLVSVASVTAYYHRILSFNPVFQPLMTLYLTDATSPQTIIDAKNTGYIVSAKLYPSGATTHSHAGVHVLKNLYPVFDMMQQTGLILNIHGEVTDPNCDIFARETHFIHHELIPLMQAFPQLKITLEHISTEQAVTFIQQANHPIAATITPHHLWLNRNDLLVGGIKPHYYCLPILKKKTDQEALIQAAISGNPRFFLGTDSAPHVINQKLSACGCAGIYNTTVALPICATIFERHHALTQLENFTSRWGAEFYQLPLNQKNITLIQEPQNIPLQLPLGHEWVVPLCAGETLSWRIL